MKNTLGKYNAIAVYPDVDHARQVVVALKEAGFGGLSPTAISILARLPEGELGALGEHELDLPEHLPVAKHVASGARTGTVVGGLAGAMLGLSAVTIPGIGLVIASAFWPTLIGAVGGGMVGALRGGGLRRAEPQ